MYTKAVMEEAASETARVMVTASGKGEDSYRAFALRRLAAVPDVAIFHDGGRLGWDIELLENDGLVTVRIEGAVRPLPVLGAFARPMGEVDEQGDVTLRTEVSYRGRPAWLEGEYASWITMWG